MDEGGDFGKRGGIKNNEYRITNNELRSEGDTLNLELYDIKKNIRSKFPFRGTGGIFAGHGENRFA